MQSWREALAAAGVAATLTSVTGPALAHPHVWIDVRTTLVAENGHLVGLRHRWTFDRLFSAWEAASVDEDGDGRFTPAELAVLAERYAQSLASWDYFTEVRTVAGAPRDLGGRAFTLTHADERLTLDLELTLDEPLPLADLDQIRVHDGTFFVSLGYPLDGSGVAVEGSDCAVFHHPPGQLDPALLARLAALPAAARELPPDVAGRVRDAAHRIQLDCPPS